VQRVAEFWNRRHGITEDEAHDNFLTHPLVHGYISLRAFGDLTSHMDAVIAELRTRTRPGARILSLGCGAAPKELTMAQALPDRSFVAGDIAEESLARALAASRERGVANLELVRADFNDLHLEQGAYAAITMLGALHHVEALEAFWGQCRRALAPGGVVLAQEYVGPSRMQWTDRQLELCNDALARLVPDEHKVHHREVVRTPVEVMLGLDPSEAVRSAEILPTCKAAGFRLQGYASGGCALLQPVLMYQVHTFDPRNWDHNATLVALFREEDRLMRAGELGDDFAMFVAAPA
jgi:SAM-dependent methyltransferase